MSKDINTVMSGEPKSVPSGDDPYVIKNSQGEEFKLEKIYPTDAEKYSPSGFNNNLWQSYIKLKGGNKWIKGASGSKEAMFNYIKEQAKGHNSTIVSSEIQSEAAKDKTAKENVDKSVTSFKEKQQLETDIINGKPVDREVIDKYPEVKKKWKDSIKIKSDKREITSQKNRG